MCLLFRSIRYLDKLKTFDQNLLRLCVKVFYEWILQPDGSLTHDFPSASFSLKFE